MLNNFNADIVNTAKQATVSSINDSREVIDFSKDWIPNLFDAVEKNNIVTCKNIVKQTEGKITTMCEPSVFMKIFKSCKTTDEADKVFRDWIEEQKTKKTGLVKEFDYHRTEKDPMLWFNTTLKGINFRPGFKREGGSWDVEQCPPLLVGDDCVHVKIAGRTGAGKSVTLNDLLNTMMFEYPPWWLELWLADFKLVEMSRYGSKVNSPHVAVIAATEMMEFVVSAMYEMYVEMSDRQKFFAKIGVQKLADFYKKYNIVLPQKLLMADEFQQMFELATDKQAQAIETLIKMIAKLGRATGYHLAFASQSMSGTVSGDVMANFKLGIALPCNDDISSTIIGNGEASKLTGKGKAIANEGTGTVKDNRHYAVPFLNADEDEDGNSAMFDNLIKMKDESDRVGFNRDLKFFKDEYLRPISELERIMPILLTNLKQYKKADIMTDDILVLGDTGLYRKDNDLEIVYFRKADKQNVMICADDLMSKSYLLKLLSTQWSYKDNQINHYCNCDPAISKIFNLPDCLETEKVYKRLLDTSFLVSEKAKRMFLYDFSENGDKSFIGLFNYLAISSKLNAEIEMLVSDEHKETTIDEELLNHYEDLFNILTLIDFTKEQDDLRNSIREVLTSLAVSDDEVYTYIRDYINESEDSDEESDSLDNMVNAMIALYQRVGMYYELYLSFCKEDTTDFDEDKLPQLNMWVVGADKSEDFDDEGNRNCDMLEAYMKTCTNYKIRFILVASDISNMRGIAKMCSHVFMKSENDKNYDTYLMDKKSYDEQYYRYRNGFENVNNFKPGMEVIPNNEKLFKMYDVEFDIEEPFDIMTGISY